MTLRNYRKVGTLPGVHPILAKKSKYRKSPILLSYKQKQYIIGCLVLFNAVLAGLTLNSNPDLRMQNLQSVEAAMAVTPTTTPDAKISTVATPAAVKTQVSAEKVAGTPTPTPTPKTAVAGVSISRTAPTSGNWDSLLQTYFGANWQAAKRVMTCESHGNPSAIGPMDSQGFRPIGLFQIKNFPGRPTTQQLMDGATNIAYAAKISGAGSNWSAWACKPY